ncbi:hypothetical protein D9M72_493060 [compost metagenome]
MDRLAGFAIPDDNGLALVGDADAGDVGGRDPRLLDRLVDREDDRLPDFLRIVLHPAGFRKMLPEFLLADASHLLLAVEDDRPARRRALIDRENISAHMPLPGLTSRVSTPFLKSAASISKNFNTMAKRMSNENKTQPIGFAGPRSNSAARSLKTQLSVRPFYA